MPNYTADQPPEAWIEIYEMAMEMMDVSDAAVGERSNFKKKPTQMQDHGDA